MSCVFAVQDGEFLWGLNVEKEYESEIPLWYTGQCPLIDDGKAIIATGGTSLMVALDMESGEVIWETPNARCLADVSLIHFTMGI